MQPLFGTEIPYSVFYTAEDAATLIERETQTAFQVHLPLLTLGSVTTSIDDFTGVINVTVVYGLPNDAQVETIIGIAYIQGNNPIYEETL
jgi:phage baseplate assembly protein W